MSLYLIICYNIFYHCALVLGRKVECVPTLDPPTIKEVKFDKTFAGRDAVANELFFYGHTGGPLYIQETNLENEYRPRLIHRPCQCPGPIHQPVTRSSTRHSSRFIQNRIDLPEYYRPSYLSTNCGETVIPADSFSRLSSSVIIDDSPNYRTFHNQVPIDNFSLSSPVVPFSRVLERPTIIENPYLYPSSSLNSPKEISKRRSFKLPKPQIISHTCRCKKTIVKPQIVQKTITVPSIQKFVQTGYLPISETINYVAIPNC